MVEKKGPITLAPFSPGMLTEAEVRHIRILRTIDPNTRELMLMTAEHALQGQAEKGTLAWPQRRHLALVVSNEPS